MSKAIVAPNTPAQLALTLGQTLDRRDVVAEWRCGIVYRFSAPLNGWVETHCSRSLRPGESLFDAERIAGGLIALVL